MKLSIFSAAVTAALLLAACGNDTSYKDTMDDYITEMSKVADALDTIETQEDVEAAALIVKNAADEMTAMAEALDGGFNSVGALRALGSRAGEMMEVQQRIATSMATLAQKDPQLLSRISEEMDALPMNK